MKKNVFSRIYHFYSKDFKQMILGKTLWAIIFVKFFSMFFIFRLFFFPNIVPQQENIEAQKEFVAKELVERITN